MRLKLGVLVGVLTVLALAGGGSAASASDDTDPGEKTGARIGVAADRPFTQAQANRFAKCMRANGVPGLKTPTVTEGRIESTLPKNVDPEVARKATEKCAPGRIGKPKLTAAEVKKLKRYAKCMRQNGVENFPNPQADGSLRLGEGVDPESDEFAAAERACEKYAPARRLQGKRSGGAPSGNVEPADPGKPVLHIGA